MNIKNNLTHAAAYAKIRENIFEISDSLDLIIGGDHSRDEIIELVKVGRKKLSMLSNKMLEHAQVLLENTSSAHELKEVLKKIIEISDLPYYRDLLSNVEKIEKDELSNEAPTDEYGKRSIETARKLLSRFM